MSVTEKFASITHDGAILMGNLFCCDGHSYERKHFVFSHMHSDHTEKLTKCLYNGQVYLSKPTRDLLEAIHNENYGGDNKNTIKKNQINTEDYEDSKIITHNGIKEKITFYPSEHVLGASQIEIVNLSLWASEAQSKINKIINPAILAHYDKKTLRSLTKGEMDQLEQLKMRILCSTDPFIEVTAEIVNSLLKNPIRPTANFKNLMANLKKDFFNRNSRKPNVDEMRKITVSCYALSETS